MKLQKVGNQNLKGQISVATNQHPAAVTHQSTPLKSDEVNFTGAPDVKAVTKKMNDIMPTMLTGMKKAKDSMGEVQNIIINAIGTGCIAPIFIKWNPLSKTDEDTRTYSAMRQPVSAVLAIVTQAGITIPFNNAIKDMAKNGWFGEQFNQTPFKDAEAEKRLIQSLRNENTIYYNTNKFDNSTTLKKIDPERYKRLLTETLNTLLKEETDELNRYEGAKKTTRVARSKYYQAHPTESKKVLDEVEQILTSNNDIKAVQKALAKKIKEMKSNKMDKELIAMVQEVDDRGAALKENLFSKFLGLFSKQKNEKAFGEVIIEEMKKKVGKMKGHVDIYKSLTPEAAEKHAVDSLASGIKELKGSTEFLKNAIKELEKGATVTDIENLFTQEAKRNKAFRLKDKKFALEVVSKLKELTGNNIGIFKQVSGLIVSCAMLPITCALLNYIYPIFMDAVFPNLSNKKHSNVSTELVDKATKNSEVK